MNNPGLSWADVERITRGRFGRTMAICPLCSDGRRTAQKRHNKVLAVTLIEPGFAVYYCNHCEASGYCRSDTATVVDIAEQHRRRAHAERHAVREKHQRTRQALELWNAAQPCRGSPIEDYLHYTRGIGDWLDTFPFLDQVFRYHPSCPFGGERLLCMLALVRDIKTDEPQAVHRSALTTGDRPERIDRKSLGPTGGGAIKISPDCDVSHGLMIGQGIETAFSVSKYYEFKPVWSVIDKNGIAKFPALSGIECVTIAVDNDPGGDGARAASACIERLTKAGIEVITTQTNLSATLTISSRTFPMGIGFLRPGTHDGITVTHHEPIHRKLNGHNAPADLGAIFTFLGDAPAAPPKELVKGLIPAEGIVVTGGQSSAGKTFIQIHKAICLATVTPYFGHKIVERVSTVLVAAEGRPLLPNRFAAVLAKLSITERLPITWLKSLPDFSSADGIRLFIAQLKALDERFQGDFGVRLGNTVIDTVAASFGMKDEDDNAEATKVCNIMRRVGEEVGALMAPVHHYGKNAESGLRGASAWKGSADVIEGVLADIDPLSGRASNRELVCAKARDGEQGPIAAFDLEFIHLGLDADGEVYGSCCVVPTERESKFDKGRAPNKGDRCALDAIDEAIDTMGEFIIPRAGMPEVKAAKVSDIRAEFDRRYVVDGTDQEKIANAKRMAFKRALDKLSPAKFGAGSAEGADWVWKLD